MLLHTRENWAQNWFLRLGWLKRQNTRIRRFPTRGRISTSAADYAPFTNRHATEDLEQRVLLSTITVTSSADRLDTTYDPANLTLRDAITIANANGGADTITFAASLNTTPIALTLGELLITDGVTIDGNGAANTIADAQQGSRIFDISSAAGSVTVAGMTLENGKTTSAGRSSAGGAGGAIFSASTATLALSADVLSGNSTTGNQASGGAIFASGPVTIVSSTISGNSTSGPNAAYGGAIYSASSVSVSGSTFSGNSTSGIHSYAGAIFSFGDLQLTNSTVTGNRTTGAGSNAGAIWSGAAVTATNSTVAQNSASSGQGGGIYQWVFDPNPVIALKNTIVAQNTDNGTAPDLRIIGGANVTLTHSLIGSNVGSGLTEAPVGSPDGFGNLIGGPTNGLIDPKLDTLASNGGPTQTMALLAGSPAIDQGDNSAAIAAGLTTDQRGAPYYRIAGAAVDIGAFESQTFSLVVTSTADVLHTTTNNPANETLRDALYIANNLATGGTITFDATVFPTGPLTVITLGGTALELSNTAASVTISGPGAATVGISGAGLSTVFKVDAGVTATINGLTVTGGSAALGGGIDNSGNLTVSSSTITSNQALGTTGANGVSAGDTGGNGGDGLGGGIYNAVGAALTVQSSTFSSNSATGGAGGSGVAGQDVVGTTAQAGAGGTGGQGGQGLGGAIYFADPNNAFSVSSTTFTGNSAQGGAGGTGGTGGNSTGARAHAGAGGAGGQGGRGAGGAAYSASGNNAFTVGSATLTGNSAQGGTGGAAGTGGSNDPQSGSYGDSSNGGDGGSGGAGGQAQGGAIYAVTVSITNSSLSTNQADGGAGGTSAAGGDSGTFYYPAGFGGTGGAGGQGGLAKGGGLFVSGSFDLDGSTFASNTALGGSGSAGSSGGHGAYYGGLGGAGGSGAMGSGGGIDSDGTSGQLTNTTLSGNHANGGQGAAGGAAGSSGGSANWNFGSGTAGDGGSGQGGGLYNASTSTLTVTADTLASNQANGNNGGNSPATFSEQSRGGNGGLGGAALGAGIANLGTLDLTNSTLASNSATGGNGGNGSTNTGGGGSLAVGGDAGAAAGGICNAGTVLAIFDTLALNQGTAGSAGTGPTAGGNAGSSTGGFEDGAGTAQIKDTIVAKNIASNSPDVSGTVSLSRSLVGDNTGSGLTEAPVGSPDGNGNLIGGTTHGRIDPLLAALGNYGGPTQTKALLAGSPAAGGGAIVNDVNNHPVTTDQRGNARFAGVVDMGAFQSPTLATVTRSTPAASPTNATSVTFTVTFNQPVLNVAAGDFTASFGSVGVTSVNSSTYHVTVNGLSGDDVTLTLGLAANQSITDAIGNPLINTIPSGTNDNTYLIDTDTPTAPTVNFFATSNSRPTITGTFATESTILTVTVNGTTYTLGSSSQLTSDGSGNWTLALTATIPNGFYTVSVHTSDAAGNNSDQTVINALVVDTTAPAVAFAGEYGVTSGSSALASITQNGNALTLHGSSTASATIVDGTHILVNGTDTATYLNSSIVFASGTFAGQTWTKLNLPPDYTNQRGVATHVTQNGASVTLVDGAGNTSPGTWVSPTQLTATAFHETVTIIPGGLLWQDGSLWSENLNLTGNKNGAGTTTITAAPSGLFVLDYLNGSGKGVHLVVNGTKTVLFVDGTGKMSAGTFINSTQAATPAFPGDNATVSNDYSTVTWQDGTIWTRTFPNAAVTVTNYTNAAGVAVHLVQNGTNQVTFVDARGRFSLGTMQSATTAVAALYPGDLATFSGNTISWQDGSLWTRTDTAGSSPIVVADYTNTSGKPVHLIENGTSNVIFVDATGHMSLGTFSDSTHASTPYYRNDVATIASDLSTLTWQDGGVWTRTAATAAITVTSYATGSGAPVYLIQNGTTQLAFVNRLNGISLGTMQSPLTALADLYPGDLATITGSFVQWQDGTLWTTTTVSPLTISFIDTNAAVSHVQLTCHTTLVGLDGPLQGLTGTRVDNRIRWSNGDVWTITGFDAVQALFQMAAGYP